MRSAENQNNTGILNKGIPVNGPLCRAAVLVGIWGLFTGGTVWSWLIGLPVVVTALVVPRLLPALPTVTVHPIGWIRFLIHFTGHAFWGGIDVSWRALHFRCPLAPTLVTYPFELKNSFAAVFFANSISLLPGTLSADLQDRQVVVHVLDRNRDVRRDLRLLELKVAELFGENMER